MRPLDVATLAFAFTGMLFFGIGIRLDDPNVRFAGLGLMIVALITRFAKGRKGN